LCKRNGALAGEEELRVTTSHVHDYTIPDYQSAEQVYLRAALILE